MKAWRAVEYVWSRLWVRSLLVLAPFTYAMIGHDRGLLTGPDYAVIAVLFVIIPAALGFWQWQQEWSRAQYAERQDEEDEG